MKFSGKFEVGFQISMVGINEDFDQLMNVAVDRIDKYVTVRNLIAKDIITISNMDKLKSSLTNWDLRSEEDGHNGWQIDVNAIIEVNVDGMKCKGDTDKDMLDKVSSMLEKYAGVFDYTYKELIDVERVVGVEAIEVYCVEHEQERSPEP